MFGCPLVIVLHGEVRDHLKPTASDLVAVVEEFDRLFEADGDQQTDDDGGDVDEEVSPHGGGVMGGMDVEHGLSLGICGYHPTSQNRDVGHPPMPNVRTADSHRAAICSG